MFLRGEVNVGADATSARVGRERLEVDPVVHAGSAGVAAEVGAGVATEADLPLERGSRARARHRVADKHAETGFEGGDLAGLGRNVVNEGYRQRSGCCTCR